MKMAPSHSLALIYIDWIISQFQLSAIFLFSAQSVEPALRVVAQ